MFEAEAGNFQRAGIQIGAETARDQDNLLTEALSPFGVSLRSQALSMCRLYALIFCFENSVRDFIRDTMFEQIGADWQQSIAPKIIEHAEKRRGVAEKDSWLEGEKSDLLGFLEFGHLAQIIINQWDYFKAIIPSQHWLKQRMDELEKTRHFIAHNRMLLPSEFERIYMYIADWNRTVGL